MANVIPNNVVEHRLIDNGREIGSIMTVGIPSLERTTSTISGAGMVMDVDMPNPVHLSATEFTITHNNGENGHYLRTPGKHNVELRIARDKYVKTEGDSIYESVKYRLVGLHKSTEDGTVEKGNPLGGTEKYSLLRIEKEVGGEVTMLIDSMASIVQYNGVNYTDEVEKLLS